MDPLAPLRNELSVPVVPSVRVALRSAIGAFSFNSLQLIAATVVWGALLLVVLALLFISPGLVLLLFLFVLPFPTAALFRLAALIVRNEPVAIRDALAWRSGGRRGLGVGVVVGGSSLVLGANVLIGASSLDPMGVAFATAAFWGLILVWFVAAALWPLLFDPLRRDEPITALVRLALIVVLIKPSRYIVLMVVLAVVLLVSTVLAAALLTVSVAYFALVMAFYALHAADRIENRATIVVTK